MPDTTVVHLLRHGEVSNPRGVLYGRLPGFRLSPEGERFDAGFPALRRPANWPRLANPFRPSWGEPYASIAARMRAVIADAAQEARGHEAVLVSHQLPIWVARRSAEERRLWHNPARRECALGSVTSFTYADGTITGVSYAEPAGGGRGGSHGA